MTKEFEGCIMGAGGQEYGVALYEQKGAVKTLARLVDAGRMRDAANLGSLAVTIDDAPRWAAKAIVRLSARSAFPCRSEFREVNRGRSTSKSW